MSPLHVGVDALNLLHDRRGIGRYARALLRRWVQIPAHELRVSLLLPHAFPRLLQRQLAALLGADDIRVYRRSAADRLALDVIWYPWSGMTWHANVPSVATVHDVWPFVSPAPDARKRYNEQTPFYATAKRTAAIITDSHFSKQEIMKYLGVRAEKIFVVHLGVDMPAVAAPDQPLGLDGAQRFVLFVGEAEERKDVETLTRALQLLPDGLRHTTGLVMVGRAPSGQRRIGRLDVGKQLNVRFEPRDGVNTIMTGEISDTVLDRLYAGAAVFAFPSRYEGFGLPVLEAMAHGLPVVASDASSVPESGGEAALYFPAGDAPGLAAALNAVLTDRDLHDRLRAAGLQRAALMSWDRCAQQTLEIVAAAARTASALAR